MRLLERAGAAVLRLGPVPRHVAFIMDGNRRFAQRNGMRIVQGHAAGFRKLKEALEWCLEMGIEICTVYAFSVENFSRSPDEVSALMNLAHEKFEEMLLRGDVIERHGARVRVLGDLARLSPRLQALVAKVMESSKHNSRLALNICFAYSARQEMNLAAAALAAGVAAGRLRAGDVTEAALQSALYTEHLEPPDLLIRTSGETRLSDFLLWQLESSHLSFVSRLWPELTCWDFFSILLDYQLAHAERKRLRDTLQRQRDAAQREMDAAEVASRGVAPTSEELDLLAAARADRLAAYFAARTQAREEAVRLLAAKHESARCGPAQELEEDDADMHATGSSDCMSGLRSDRGAFPPVEQTARV